MSKARLKAVVGLLGLVMVAVSARPFAQALFFVDGLTGPASPELSVPSDKYSYTPAGLQRVVNIGGETDRPMVSTLSSAYLAATHFTAELTVDLPGKDLMYLGFGQGAPDAAYYNEPGNAFLLRIHNWDGYWGVQASARGANGNTFLDNHEIGNYSGGAQTFRIARNCDDVTLSIVGTNPVQSWTYKVSQFSGTMGLTNTNTHLFFGNTFTGSVLSNFSVTEGSGDCSGGGGGAAAPVIASLAPSLSSIWPPNGKMVPVTVQAIATGSPQPACTISSVSSNEGSARPSGPQFAITGPMSVNLQAERLGSGTGRVYSIVVTCTNSSGTTSATTRVAVPHDQRR